MSIKTSVPIVVFSLLLILLLAAVVYPELFHDSVDKQQSSNKIAVSEGSTTQFGDSSSSELEETLSQQLAGHENFNDRDASELVVLDPEVVKGTGEDHKLARKHFSALSSISPRAFMGARKATVRHKLSLLESKLGISDSQRSEVAALFEEIFNRKAAGDKDFTQFEHNALVEIIGEDEAQEFLSTKASLQAEEIIRSVKRRVDSLDEQLKLSTDQTEFVENALLRLEESRGLVAPNEANLEKAHKQRVALFESELKQILTAKQFENYLDSNKGHSPKQGINPFTR